MQLGCIVACAADVPASLGFLDGAVSLEHHAVDESGAYGKLDTGSATRRDHRGSPLWLCALIVPLLTGCTAGAPPADSKPPAAGAPPAAQAPNEPPPKIRAWMDRLTVPHDYDPKTGFIVARKVTPLPPIVANAPPLDQAVADAGSSRTVIVFVTADRCAPCQQYKLDAVGNPDVIARLSDPRFLPTHLEVDRSPELAERYLGTQSIPMTYALRGGTVTAQLPGQRSAADLLAWIDTLSH